VNDWLTKMSERQLPSHLQEELSKLSLLPEERVDTSDIPEVTDFSRFKRGRFLQADVTQREYDIRAIANWFIRKFRESRRQVTNLSLNKIVYFAIERALIERMVLLSPAKIEAWQHGPVFREIYHTNKGEGSEPISNLIERFDLATKRRVPAEETFSTEDEEFLEGIFRDFGTLTASRLVSLSHEREAPWDHVWRHSRKVNFGMEITKEVIFALAPRSRPSDGRQKN
jgi:uncharacterized phage-associated protein